MNFIKFIMSQGPAFTLPEEQADRIFKSGGQIMNITDSKGKWTGQTINKAHIVSTVRDFEAERDWHRDNAPRLSAPQEKPLTKEEAARIEKKRQEIRNFFRHGKSSGPKSVKKILAKKSL